MGAFAANGGQITHEPEALVKKKRQMMTFHVKAKGRRPRSKFGTYF
jgi:hypothetical protein